MSDVLTVKEAVRRVIHDEFEFTTRHPNEEMLWSSRKNKYFSRFNLLIWERVQTTNERLSGHSAAAMAVDLPRFKRDNTVDERALDAMIDQSICAIWREMYDACAVGELQHA